MDVSLCIPAYRPHGEPNLATVATALPAALDGLSGELVVALNGVSPQEVGVPAGARTVDLGINRGVGPGWNAAAREARGELLVFANDDVELGPGSLAVLARVLRERPEVGVAGPVGTRWDIPAGEHRSVVDLTGLATGDIAACEVVSGFLFATRRDVFDATGGFDEAYAPASWEEVDFACAVRAQGLQAVAVAGCDVAHEWGISAKAPPWRTVRWGGRRELLWSIHRRNRRHFLRKWASRELPPVGTEGVAR